eukprot:g3269.t1
MAAEVLRRSLLYCKWIDSEHGHVHIGECTKEYQRLRTSFRSTGKDSAKFQFTVDEGAASSIVGHAWSRDEERALEAELKAREAGLKPVSKFWVAKLETETETAKNWDIFYRRHGANFFKDRHYMDSDFEELSKNSPFKTLLEAGCGVGNSRVRYVYFDHLMSTMHLDAMLLFATSPAKKKDLRF